MTPHRPAGVYLIGARDGNVPLAIPPVFSAEWQNVFVEADPAAVPLIRARNPQAHVIEAALGERDAPAHLNVTLSLHASSLYEPVRDEFDYTLFAGFCDYRPREMFEVMERLPVDLRRLDGIDALRDPQFPYPDVLVIDTQGSELDILQGGAETIAASTLAIITEVSFSPLYEGQPLYGDLARTLHEWGFVLAGFLEPVSYQPFPTPFALRGNGFLMNADALFLRRPTRLPPHPQAAARLAFIAHALNQHAFAHNCAPRGAAAPPQTSAFLEAVAAALDATPALAPQDNGKIVDFALSRALDDPKSAAQARVELTRRSHAAGRELSERLAELRTLLSAEETPVERVFRQYGFATQAASIKQTRLSLVGRYLNALGFA